MKSILSKIKTRLVRVLMVTSLPLAGMAAAGLLTSCADFFEQDSDHVIYADQDHLSNATDSIYSVTGIMNKLQAIADRTILLGEARADLVDITSYTASDLRDVALFNVDDENMYNQPRDYYAVINNCNYFLKMVDDSLKNNRNEYIFQREIAAVKAYRAWTYLQLALNYGSVPFYTEPLLTKEESDKEFPRYDLKAICEYFIADLMPYTETGYPGYNIIKSMQSRLFYFPVYVVLGDLNLWAGHYKDAAMCYYNYISKRNGTNSTYPTTLNSVHFDRGSTTWDFLIDSWVNSVYNEGYSTGSELISMIPGDSILSEGYYSQLRNIFNTNSENDYKVSLTPSQAMFNLSEDQWYCHITNTLDTIYAPHNLEDHLSGDLRLYACYRSSENYYNEYGNRYTSQNITKYSTRNIHIYRRTMLYLRMAEAMNAAGYPRFAYAVLTKGLSNSVLEKDVIPYYSADSTFLRQFDFPNTRYVIRTTAEQSAENMMGIHDHGSGFSQYNKYYQLAVDTTITDSLQRIAFEQKQVEKLLLDECGLEFAFEGTRWYDLMRFALRNNDPSILADRVYGRRGELETSTMRGLIKVDLYNTQNWYLSWGGKIGLK